MDDFSEEAVSLSVHSERVCMCVCVCVCVRVCVSAYVYVNVFIFGSCFYLPIWSLFICFFNLLRLLHQFYCFSYLQPC